MVEFWIFLDFNSVKYIFEGLQPDQHVGFGQPTDQTHGCLGGRGVVQEGEREELGMSLRF